MNPSASDPARCEIWYARFDPIVGREQSGERPCLVLSDVRFNQSRAELVIVLPINRTERGIASHVRVVPSAGGLKERQLYQVRRYPVDFKTAAHDQVGQSLADDVGRRRRSYEAVAEPVNSP